MSTPIAGFSKIGINNCLKRKAAIYAFFCVALIFGNFFSIKIDIILQRHFTEYGNKYKLFFKFANICSINSTIF